MQYSKELVSIFESENVALLINLLQSFNKEIQNMEFFSLSMSVNTILKKITPLDKITTYINIEDVKYLLDIVEKECNNSVKSITKNISQGEIRNSARDTQTSTINSPLSKKRNGPSVETEKNLFKFLKPINIDSIFNRTQIKSNTLLEIDRLKKKSLINDDQVAPNNVDKPSKKRNSSQKNADIDIHEYPFKQDEIGCLFL